MTLKRQTIQEEAEKKGEAIGLAKGETIGIAKGKTKEKLEIAKKLKGMGVGIDIIEKGTGLTQEQIEKL